MHDLGTAITELTPLLVQLNYYTVFCGHFLNRFAFSLRRRMEWTCHTHGWSWLAFRTSMFLYKRHLRDTTSVFLLSFGNILQHTYEATVRR